MKWTPYGPNAWLLRFAERVGDEAFARGRAIATELERRPPPGLVEFVPAFATVLLEFDPARVSDSARLLSGVSAQLENALAARLPPSPVKEIPVVYDGADLERVARMHELTTAEVRDRHSAPIYKVYLLGFSPGFPYLGDLDPRLHTPRLASPRPRVTAGSVAIGGEHTGIYTVDSPGGWNIIGRTPLKIFDPQRRGASGTDDTAMFLLRQGDRVKFVPTDSN
jgi:KipI family sensor histidine kinase inhibitor